MPHEPIYQTLNEVFRDVFDDPSITVDSDTVAGDVPGWDSMTHVSLVVATEAKLGIKFKSAEMEALKNVGQLVEVISRHLSAK